MKFVSVLRSVCAQSTPIFFHDVLFHWKLAGPLSQIHVSNFIRPMDPKYSSQTVVGGGLQPFDGFLCCPPSLGSIKWDRFHAGLEEPNLKLVWIIKVASRSIIILFESKGMQENNVMNLHTMRHRIKVKEVTGA